MAGRWLRRIVRHASIPSHAMCPGALRHPGHQHPQDDGNRYKSGVKPCCDDAMGAVVAEDDECVRSAMLPEARSRPEERGHSNSINAGNRGKTNMFP